MQPNSHISWHRTASAARRMTRTACAVLATALAALAQDPAQMLGFRVAELDATMPALRVDVADDTARPAPIAWAMLALAANGNTLRTGPQRDLLKQLTMDLRALRTPESTLRTSALEHAREETLLATFALAQVCVSSQYRLLLQDVRVTAAATHRMFTEDGAQPASAREIALLAMASTCMGETFAAAGDDLLRVAIDAIDKLPTGRDRFVDAVRHLVSLARGEQFPADLTVALCAPAELEADPLHTAVAAFVMRRTPLVQRARQHERLRGLLARRRPDGLWPAADGEPEDARLVRSAMLAAAIGMTAPFVDSELDGGDPPRNFGDPWREPIK